MVMLNFLDQPALIQAIFQSDLEQVRELVLKREDINFQDCEGRSPLHAAAFVGSAEIADFLLLSGARVNKKDSQWITPLHRACRNLKDDVVEVLLRHQCDVSPRDRNWQTPLHICATHDSVRCAEYLLSLLKEGVNCGDRQGRTPLHIAAYHGHLDMVELLIQFKADVNARDKKERRAVHWAAFNGHWDVVRMLVLSGADPSARDKEALTPLHCAAANGHLTVCTYLFGPEVGSRLGVEVNSGCQKGNTPLHLAANNGKEKVVEFLLQVGAELDARNAQELTPFHYAAASPDGTGCMELLIRKGADVNSRTADGRTALHLTAVYGRFSRAQTLVAHGANVDLLDNEGNSPLHVAARYGHELLIKKLIDNNADVNKRGEKGLSPLHLAAFQGYADPVRLLLEYKADTTLIDDLGRTCLHLAALSPKDKSNCVRFLIDKGASCSVRDRFGREALHNACFRANLSHVEDLCVKTGNCNLQDKEGRTPLHMLALADANQRGEEQLVLCAKVLLDKRANTMKFDKSGYLPLHYAAYEGHSLLCERLLNAAKLQSPPRTENGTQLTPLHLAAMSGHSKTLEVLLQYFNEKKAAIPQFVPRKLSYDPRKTFSVGSEMDSRGFTALHFACAKGHAECVRVFMNHADRPGITTPERKRGMNPLHVAAGFGNVSCLRHMVAETEQDVVGALTLCDRAKRTPLMLGISSCSVETALYLLDQGAPPKAVDNKARSCLHRAAAVGMEKACQELLASGILPVSADQTLRSAIYFAAQGNHVAVLEILLSKLSREENPDLVLADMEGFTPLHWAAFESNEQCLELLLDHPVTRVLSGSNFSPLHCAVMAGKEVNLQLMIEKLGKDALCSVDDSGRTPLHLASGMGHSECAAILLAAGVDPNVRDCDGKTSLCYAAKNGYLPITDNLLKSGADVLLCDNQRNTCLHLACIEHEEDIAAALIDHPSCCSEFLDAQNERGKTALHLSARGGLVPVVERLLLAGANVRLMDEEERCPALSCAISDDVADCLELILLAMGLMSTEGPQVSKRVSQRISCPNFPNVVRSKNRGSAAGTSAQSSDSEFY